MHTRRSAGNRRCQAASWRCAQTAASRTSTCGWCPMSTSHSCTDSAGATGGRNLGASSARAAEALPKRTASLALSIASSPTRTRHRMRLTSASCEPVASDLRSSARYCSSLKTRPVWSDAHHHPVTFLLAHNRSGRLSSSIHLSSACDVRILHVYGERSVSSRRFPIPSRRR